MKVAGIVLAAGRGTRIGADKNKMLLNLANKTPLELTLQSCREATCLDEVVLVCKDSEREQMREIADAIFPEGEVILASGGATRQDSAYSGILAASPDCDILAVLDGARCFTTPELIENCVRSCIEHGSGVAGCWCTDTVKLADAEGCFLRTLDRNRLVLVETPQVFPREILKLAYEKAREDGFLGTDDSSLVERLGLHPRLVVSGGNNFKLTHPKDIVRGTQEVLGVRDLRIGQGYDIHALKEGRPFLLAGVRIESSLGLDGHSDADVLAHAVIDALLGAAGQRDIGEFFPDTDPAYRGADSMKLLEQVWAMLQAEGYALVNLDTTIFLEKPKLSPYKRKIIHSLAKALGAEQRSISVKAKTAEQFDAVGEGLACAASATCLMTKQKQS